MAVDTPSHSIAFNVDDNWSVRDGEIATRSRGDGDTEDDDDDDDGDGDGDSGQRGMGHLTISTGAGNKHSNQNNGGGGNSPNPDDVSLLSELMSPGGAGAAVMGMDSPLTSGPDGQLRRRDTSPTPEGVGSGTGAATGRDNLRINAVFNIPKTMTLLDPAPVSPLGSLVGTPMASDAHMYVMHSALHDSGLCPSSPAPMPGQQLSVPGQHKSPATGKRSLPNLATLGAPVGMDPFDEWSFCSEEDFDSNEKVRIAVCQFMEAPPHPF